MLEAFDILVPGNFERLLAWAQAGNFSGLHLGTPCATYSRARKFDGGPPPLRSNDFLEGLPDLSEKDWAKVLAGTTFLKMSVELAYAVHAAGGFFTLENPASSMLWLTEDVKQLEAYTGAVQVYMDMCQYGSPHKQPTVFLASDPAFLIMARRCAADHTHVPLRAKPSIPTPAWKSGSPSLRRCTPRSCASSTLRRPLALTCFCPRPTPTPCSSPTWCARRRAKGSVRWGAKCCGNLIANISQPRTCVLQELR